MKPMKTLPLLLLALAVGAQAQDDSDTGWHSSVGAKIGVAPRYLGSDKSHIAVAPDFTFTDGTFFADSERGLGAQYQNGDGFTASAALNYDLGRTEKNSIYRPGSKELKGMGRVKGSALANVGVSQEITPWLTVSGDVNVPFAGQKHRGQDFRLGVSSALPMGDSDQLILSADALGGSSNFNRTYFGVTPEQSARSGYRAHKTKAGIYGYSAGAGWEHQFDENWTTGANLGVTRLTARPATARSSRRKRQRPLRQQCATTSNRHPINPLHAPRLRRFFFCALPVAALTCRRFHIWRF